MEERVLALENQVAAINRRLDDAGAAPVWFERLRGAMKDYPEFGRVVDYGKSLRESQPYANEDDAEC